MVYDVGANFGMFTLFFARAVGESGRVVAFEPVAWIFARLARNLRLNDISNVLAVPLGLGAAAEARAAYAAAGAGTASTVASASAAGGYRPAGTMNLAPMDAVVAARSLPPPSFIKLDVEGAELDVLRGGEAVLRASRPDLFIELHGNGTVEKAEGAARLCEFLADRGYTLYHVESGGRVMPVAPPGMGHLLCLARAGAGAAPASPGTVALRFGLESRESNGSGDYLHR